MPREVTVITPENIPLTLELAGLGSRFGALLLDITIQTLVTLTLFFVGAMAAAAASLSGLSGWLTALGVIAVFLIWFGYFILFETIWNGQTPGKKAFGLRVVRDGGYPINVFSAAARNLIRIADFVPVAYGVGALAVFFHPQYKRLGDLAAGTLVVKERAAGSLGAGSYVPRATTQNAVSGMLPPTVRHPSDVLSADELALLRRFALRRWEMTPDDSERLAYRLVVPLVERLNLTFVPGAPPRYADLVSVLVAAADAREEESRV